MKPGPNDLLLPGETQRPAGWVTIERLRDGKRMHTPAWAWRRIEGKTDVAKVVPERQPSLFG